MGRGDECPSCRRPCKVCLNCTYYDPQAYHECREPQAEWVKNKDEGNFCSYFSPNAIQATANQEAEKVRNQLDALFGQKPGDPSGQKDPKDDLSRLFKREDAENKQLSTPSEQGSSLEDEIKKFLKSK